MSEGWNIAVLGATGAVGRALFEALAERQFLVGRISALVRNGSASGYLRFSGKLVIVKDVAEFDWTQAQLAFFATDVGASAAYTEDVTDAECLVIDLSGPSVLEPDVLLVVSDVNLLVLDDCRNRDLIAVLNSLTSQLLTALRPFTGQGGLSRVSVTNLLSVSGQGKKVVGALAGQSAKPLDGIPIDEDDFFGRQPTFNMLPLLPDRGGSVCEERRIADETRRTLQDDGLMTFASVVQLPAFYGHVQVVNLEAMRPLAAGEARDVFTCSENIELSKGGEFSTQADDAFGSARLSISYVCDDYGMLEQTQLWSVADNVCSGGALVTAKVIEKLIKGCLY